MQWCKHIITPSRSRWLHVTPCHRGTVASRCSRLQIMVTVTSRLHIMVTVTSRLHIMVTVTSRLHIMVTVTSRLTSWLQWHHASTSWLQWHHASTSWLQWHHASTSWLQWHHASTSWLQWHRAIVAKVSLSYRRQFRAYFHMEVSAIKIDFRGQQLANSVLNQIHQCVTRSQKGKMRAAKYKSLCNSINYAAPIQQN